MLAHGRWRALAALLGGAFPAPPLRRPCAAPARRSQTWAFAAFSAGRSRAVPAGTWPDSRGWSIGPARGPGSPLVCASTRVNARQRASTCGDGACDGHGPPVGSGPTLRAAIIWPTGPGSGASRAARGEVRANCARCGSRGQIPRLATGASRRAAHAFRARCGRSGSRGHIPRPATPFRRVPGQIPTAGALGRLQGPVDRWSVRQRASTCGDGACVGHGPPVGSGPTLRAAIIWPTGPGFGRFAGGPRRVSGELRTLRVAWPDPTPGDGRLAAAHGGSGSTCTRLRGLVTRPGASGSIGGLPGRRSMVLGARAGAPTATHIAAGPP
jgi:hypothetical protein